MKKLLLSLLLCAFSFAGVMAQSGNYHLSAEAEKKCTQLTRNMANELSLNEMAYIQLKDINKEFFGKSEELQKLHKEDASTLNAKLAALEVAFNEKVKNLLTPAQLVIFADMKKLDNGMMAASSER